MRNLINYLHRFSISSITSCQLEHIILYRPCLCQTSKLIQILQTKHGGEWKIIQQKLHYFNCFLDLTWVIITVPIKLYNLQNINNSHI